MELMDRGNIHRVKIDVATSGENTLVAAVEGRKIRVLQLAFICTAAVTVKFESEEGTDVDLTGAMAFPDNGGIATPWCPAGHFETGTNKDLDIVLGGAIQVSGWLVYQLVKASGTP